MREENITKRKVWLGVFLAVVAVLIIVLVILVVTYNDEEDVVSEDDNAGMVIETKEDEYGNVTTVNPELITTYFPYQAMRDHEEYGSTLRYFLSIDEGSTVIDAVIEYCDVENDKALVQQYIDAIPLDLSAYTVNYETFYEDARCVD